MKKEQIDYNKVVNIEEDGEIHVLNYVFNHGSFKGAVGSRYYPVTEEEIQDRISEYEADTEAYEEYLWDASGDRDWAKQHSKYNSREDLLHMMFDLSDEDFWPELREQCDLTEEQAVIFGCTGGGRMFDKDFQGNVNPELSEIIREYEQQENH